MRSSQSSCWQFVHGILKECLEDVCTPWPLLLLYDHAVKHSHSYLNSKCWSDGSIDVNFHIFWWWKSAPLMLWEQNSAGGGNNWQQAHSKNLCSDPTHVTYKWGSRSFKPWGGTSGLTSPCHSRGFLDPREPRCAQGQGWTLVLFYTAAGSCCNHLITASGHWLDLESAAVGQGGAGRMCASLRTGVPGGVLPSCTSPVGLGSKHQHFCRERETENLNLFSEPFRVFFWKDNSFSMQ